MFLKELTSTSSFGLTNDCHEIFQSACDDGFGSSAGKRKGLAFIQDPDGYWIEIFTPDKMAALMAP